MHLPHMIDEQARTNRWARCHPAEKLTASGVGVLLALTAASPWLPLAVAVAGLAGLSRAGVPGRVFRKALGMPVGFLLAGVAPLVLTLSQPPAAPWLPVHIAPEGLRLAAATLARSCAVTICTVGLALTTPIDDLIWMAQRLGLPPSLSATVMAVHRFLFQFTRTLATLHAAQRARLGFRGWRGTVRSLGLLTANLFTQSSQLALTLERGLVARGGISIGPRPVEAWRPARVGTMALVGLLVGLWEQSR